MNKKDELPTVSTVPAREAARAIVFVLQILHTVVLRISAVDRQHFARLSALADQLGEAAQRVRVLSSHTPPSVELVDGIRDGIKLAKTALIELEPQVKGTSVSVFFYRLRSAIANSIWFILRRPIADPIVAVRKALATLDRIQEGVDTPPRQNSGEKSPKLPGSHPSAATDQSRQQGLEPEQSVQSGIIPLF